MRSAGRGAHHPPEDYELGFNLPNAGRQRTTVMHGPELCPGPSGDHRIHRDYGGRIKRQQLFLSSLLRADLRHILLLNKLNNVSTCSSARCASSTTSRPRPGRPRAVRPGRTPAGSPSSPVSTAGYADEYGNESRAPTTRALFDADHQRRPAARREEPDNTGAGHPGTWATPSAQAGGAARGHTSRPARQVL